MSAGARVLFPAITYNKRKASERLTGKTILITGATFGIGEALTRHLLQYKVHLILIGRTMERLLALESESQAMPARVTTFRCDFYSEEEIAGLCSILKTVHIDYFVSNAGKSMMRSFEDTQDRLHDYKRTIAVNYLAPVQIITGLANSFRLARTHIVNVTTYNVLMKTPPKWGAYVSSKKAMHSWIESNRAELTLMGITVSNIYLPLVESRMKEANKRYERAPAMSMDSAVAVIIKGVVSRIYRFIPWWHIPFQGVMLLASPFWDGFWYRQIRRNN